MSISSVPEHFEYSARNVHPFDELPEVNGNDIYRGEQSTAIPIVIDRAESVAGSEAPSASSSSSSWSGLGLRKGALGAILELAINRWARATSGSSSRSSISSVSSVNTRNRRRSKRRPSLSTSINTHSEHIIRARLKARGIGRTIPREFVLFLPPALVANHHDKRVSMLSGQRIFRSSSLPLVLTRLDAAIKRLAKLRRPARLRSLSPEARTHEFDLKALDYVDNIKGKARERVELIKALPPSQPAWWLDVSSPTWSDMREIGKLLHLHPLTLEDILHQETREKVEAFPRLGYYFIVFRALESEKTRAKVTQLHLNLENDGGIPHFDGIVGATNIYIIVFRDGICTFHFEDISEHTSRVQNRIVQLEQTFCMSSEWLAHGILDSVVDQFFPLLDRIDREVKDLDDLISPIPSSNTVAEVQTQLTHAHAEKVKLQDHTLEKVPKNPVKNSSNKEEVSVSSVDSVLKAKPVRVSFLSIIQCISLSLKSIYDCLKMVRRSKPKSNIPFTPQSPLMRMAATRRLVTSLSRLLGTKSEVLSQLKKRSAMNPLGSASQTTNIDVGVYLDDIQDHILTLYQSLAHNERILSHHHPAYISHLRVKDAQARSGTDKGIMTLTLISIAAAAMQIPTGTVSINVGRVPGNRRTSRPGQHPAPFNGFLVIVTIVLLLAAGIVGITRYWWLQAGKKYTRKLA